MLTFRTFVGPPDITDDAQLCRNVFQLLADSFLAQWFKRYSTLAADFILIRDITWDFTDRDVFDQFIPFCFQIGPKVTFDRFFDRFLRRTFCFNFSFIE